MEPGQINIVREPAWSESGEGDAVDAAVVEAASLPYVRRWNRLVSETNWEKGRIICEWRRALQEAGFPVTAYSDEAWARSVEGVSPQHVGRLRRVYERFGTIYRQFADLSWTHFFAAYPWSDAEMWLEGAVHNGWSVSQMRQVRQETLAALGRADDDLSSDASPAETPFHWDEDVPVEAVEENDHLASKVEVDAAGELLVTSIHVPDGGEDVRDSGAGTSDEMGEGCADRHEQQGKTAPGEAIPWDKLPEDFFDAVDAMKVAILRHKSLGWHEVSQATVLCVIDYLKHLVVDVPN